MDRSIELTPPQMELFQVYESVLPFSSVPTAATFMRLALDQRNLTRLGDRAESHPELAADISEMERNVALFIPIATVVLVREIESNQAYGY